MAEYTMAVTIEYSSNRADAGDRQNAIIAAIGNLHGVRVTCENEAEEVERTKGDDCGV